MNFGGPQSGPGFDDREESHIASIWPPGSSTTHRRWGGAIDRRKMGRSDGRKNSQNLTVRGIYRFHLNLTQSFRLNDSLFQLFWRGPIVFE